MTSLFKKLNFKGHETILIVNAPDSISGDLEEMRNFCDVETQIHTVKKIGFVMVFVTRQNEIYESIDKIFPKLESDAVLWFSYPKGTSKKYKCDFNRDTGWEKLGAYNLEEVRQVAVDADWSAVRFRKVEFIKKMTRNTSFALSEEGKKRARK